MCKPYAGASAPAVGAAPAHVMLLIPNEFITRKTKIALLRGYAGDA